MATPAVFVTDTFPVVEKPAIFDVLVPLMVIFETLAIKVPLFTNPPPNVRSKLLVGSVFNVAEELLILRVALITFAPPRVTVPALLAIITPPEPFQVSGNSAPVICAPLPLYCKVAPEPYTGNAVAVVVPSIESMPLTAIPVLVI